VAAEEEAGDEEKGRDRFCLARVLHKATDRITVEFRFMTTITCKISTKLNAQLEVMARRRRVSKSAILREALESKTKVTARSATPSAHDLVKHLCGSLRGPKDLSTNPKRLRGFGE